MQRFCYNDDDTQKGCQNFCTRIEPVNGRTQMTVFIQEIVPQACCYLFWGDCFALIPYKIPVIPKITESPKMSLYINGIPAGSFSCTTSGDAISVSSGEKKSSVTETAVLLRCPFWSSTTNVHSPPTSGIKTKYPALSVRPV